MTAIDSTEQKRLVLQSQLDDTKTSDDRNRMGQFATPTALAREILRYGVELLGKNEPVSFLDPAIGTGSFYSALCATVPAKRIKSAIGYEIDPCYGAPAKAFWKRTQLEMRLKDFTLADPGAKATANLLICNPPYVRHHHIDAKVKAALQRRTERACGVTISGLSGLYCYFMGLSHPWMADGGFAGWLIPSEFMGVNYGRMLKDYLLKKITLLHIHRFDPNDVQFADALVSSSVVWIKNTPPPKDHRVKFSFGGTLAKPAIKRMVAACDLIYEKKWTRYPHAEKFSVRSEITLGDLLDIKRGLATGDNSFFIMDHDQIAERGLPMKFFRPVLPGSRHIPYDEIMADKNGWPMLDKQLFLLDPRISERELAAYYPELKAYLDTGQKGEKPVAKRYLCKNRTPWYTQENRPPAPIICTYMGRCGKKGKPFRFILNHSNATACNTYLMLYPKPVLSKFLDRQPDAMRAIWTFLNEIETDNLLSYGRVYGGGLHKLEPKELCAYPADSLIKLIPDLPMEKQGDLFAE